MININIFRILIFIIIIAMIAIPSVYAQTATPVPLTDQQRQDAVQSFIDFYLYNNEAISALEILCIIVLLFKKIAGGLW